MCLVKLVVSCRTSFYLTFHLCVLLIIFWLICIDFLFFIFLITPIMHILCYSKYEVYFSLPYPILCYCHNFYYLTYILSLPSNSYFQCSHTKLYNNIILCRSVWFYTETFQFLFWQLFLAFIHFMAWCVEFNMPSNKV